MRTINATLTTQQKKLTAQPYHSVVIGTPGGTTYDASAYLVAYRYEEQAELPGRHEITLDNKAGTFNTLTGARAPIAHGAIVTFTRGVTLLSVNYSAELPRVWIEALEYTYHESRSLFVLHCADPWEKLMRTRVPYALDPLLNGDFELYTAGPTWTHWTNRVSDGALADEGSIVHAGDHAVKITAGASIDTWVYQDLVTEPYRTYTFHVWTRGDGTHSGRYAIYDSVNQAWITELTSYDVTGTDYTRVELTWTTPARCTGMRLYLACPDTDTGICYVDDAALRAPVSWTNAPGSQILEWIVETAGLTLYDIVLNGDFEAYAAGPAWTHWTNRVSDGALANEDTITHSGTHAVKATAGAGVDTWVYQDVITEPSRRYTLRVWTRGDGTYSGRYAIYDTINTAWIATLTSLDATGTMYNQVDVNWAAPAGCTGVRVYLACPATDTGVCYFDDAEVLAAIDDLTLDFAIVTSEHLLNATRRLLRTVTQYAYFALDGALKTKELDPDEASLYTYGWNAQHELLQAQRYTDRAWEANTVTVLGYDIAVGTAADATQVAAVGTRQVTVHDVRLTTDAGCTAAATALLRYFQARADETILVARPTHGLELYDVVTLDDPPWGGADVTGRVIALLESYDRDKARWQQVVTLGYPSHYVNRSAADGSLILNIPSAAIVADSLETVSKWTGNLIVDGELKLLTDGYVRAGQTAYNKGSGFWLEYNAGTPRISLGKPSGNRVTWDGTKVQVSTDALTVGTHYTLPPTGTIAITDGVTAPASSISGRAILYIDTADGDLKIRFANGFVATIVADS